MSEIVLFSPSILGFLICYILTYCLVLFVPKGKIKKGWMLFYQSLIAVFLMFYIFRNSSALSEEVWGGLYLITVIPLYAIVLIPNSLLLPSSKYSLLIPFLLMIYFSVSESIVVSATVHYSKYYIPVKLKLKSGSGILSSPDFKYIGRTSKYWFFYSTKNDFTRIIPEEDVSIGEISNFKTLFKSKDLNTLMPVDPRKVN